MQWTTADAEPQPARTKLGWRIHMRIALGVPMLTLVGLAMVMPVAHLTKLRTSVPHAECATCHGWGL